MTLAAINNVRRLPWFGIAASAVIAAFGIGDLGRVTRIGSPIEIGIASLAACGVDRVD
jgi:hypothetical protein